MVQYRRNLVAGGTYFFTVTLVDRRSNLLIRHIDVLRESLKKVQQHHPFEIVAWVVLPDHIHAVWTLPSDDSDYSNRWRAIKSHFVRAVKKTRSSHRHAGRWFSHIIATPILGTYH